MIHTAVLPLWGTTGRARWLAFGFGMVAALAKLVASFLGSAPFFAVDLVVGGLIAAFTARHPRAVVQWVVALGGPTLCNVAFTLFVVRSVGPETGLIGAWWKISAVTVPLACVAGAVLGSRFSRPPNQKTSSK